MSLTEVINLILFAAFIFVAYFSIRRSLRRRSNSREPLCATCRYRVIGLTTPTCPECGSNLLIKGILPPGRTAYRIVLPLLWSVFILIAGNIAGDRLSVIHYRSKERWYRLSLRGMRDDPCVIISGYSEGYSSKQSPTELKVAGIGPSSSGSRAQILVPGHGLGSETIPGPDGPRGTIACDMNSGQWTLTSPSGSIRSFILSNSILERWLADLGFPTATARTEELRRAIMTVHDTRNFVHFDLEAAMPVTEWWLNQSGGGGSDFPAESVQHANAWLFAYLWALGLGPILVRGPRAVRGDAAARFVPVVEQNATS